MGKNAGYEIRYILRKEIYIYFFSKDDSPQTLNVFIEQKPVVLPLEAWKNILVVIFFNNFLPLHLRWEQFSKADKHSIAYVYFACVYY